MSESHPASPAPKTPNEELAELVVVELKNAGLIPDSKVEEITLKVATGVARQDEWLVWIEQAIDKKAKGAAHGQA